MDFRDLVCVIGLNLPSIFIDGKFESFFYVKYREDEESLSFHTYIIHIILQLPKKTSNRYLCNDALW